MSTPFDDEMSQLKGSAQVIQDSALRTFVVLNLLPLMEKQAQVYAEVLDDFDARLEDLEDSVTPNAVQLLEEGRNVVVNLLQLADLLAKASSILDKDGVLNPEVPKELAIAFQDTVAKGTVWSAKVTDSLKTLAEDQDDDDEEEDDDATTSEG